MRNQENKIAPYFNKDGYLVWPTLPLINEIMYSLNFDVMLIEEPSPHLAHEAVMEMLLEDVVIHKMPAVQKPMSLEDISLATLDWAIETVLSSKQMA